MPAPVGEQTPDERLLAALAQRLEERRLAQEESARTAVELRKLNGRLEAAERLKSQFLSNIRNEINNPLTAMRGFAAAIAGNPALTAQQVHEMAVTMHREVSNLAFQMQNIFAAADLESGTLHPEWTRVNVTAVVAEVVADFSREAERRSVTLRFDPSGPLIAILDQNLVCLMVSNLVANAVEFSPRGGAVAIRLQATTDRVSIEVEDQGAGIADQYTERIFDRFVQLSSGTTKAHPGHGLGLAVVRDCAELLEGRVTLRSKLGEGATFQIELPRRRESPVEAAARCGQPEVDEVLETF